MQGAFHTHTPILNLPSPTCPSEAPPHALQPQSSFPLGTPAAFEAETPRLVFLLPVILLSNWLCVCEPMVSSAEGRWHSEAHPDLIAHGASQGEPVAGTQQLID